MTINYDWSLVVTQVDWLQELLWRSVNDADKVDGLGEKKTCITRNAYSAVHGHINAIIIVISRSRRELCSVRWMLGVHPHACCGVKKALDVRPYACCSVKWTLDFRPHACCSVKWALDFRPHACCSVKWVLDVCPHECCGVKRALGVRPHTSQWSLHWVA